MRCVVVAAGFRCAGVVASCTSGAEPPLEIAGLPAQCPNSGEEFERPAASPLPWPGSGTAVRSYEDSAGRLDDPFSVLGATDPKPRAELVAAGVSTARHRSRELTA